MKIYIFGIGETGGGPVPESGGGFAKDESGKMSMGPWVYSFEKKSWTDMKPATDPPRGTGQCLMTGDRLETDVLMGVQAGMASALTLTGATALGNNGTRIGVLARQRVPLA